MSDRVVGEIDWFDLAELVVDQDNNRLGSYPNQPATIKAMLRQQKHKLIALAEDILIVGLSPGEPLWVAPAPDEYEAGKFIVMEGNRRVTALKVMNEPGLGAGTSSAAAFDELGKRFLDNPRRRIKATLFASVEAARPWVERRHRNEQDGVGIEWWDPFAQDRANVQAGKPRTLSMVALDYLSDGNIPSLADELDISESTTNADRILGTFNKSMGRLYGISIKSNSQVKIDGDRRIADEVLRTLLASVSSVSSRDLNSEPQRMAHIRQTLSSLPPPDDPGAPSGPGGPTPPRPGPGDRSPPSPPGRPAKPPTRKPLPDDRSRATLAPTSTRAGVTLRVEGRRLAGLYTECRECVVRDAPNSAAMLLRVFLELSCEAYLEAMSVRPPGTRSDWRATGISLTIKIHRVLKHLDQREDNHQLDDARAGVDRNDHIHSIPSLHRAMHDRDQMLDPGEIKTSWDRWHPLLNEIHEAIASL